MSADFCIIEIKINNKINDEYLTKMTTNHENEEPAHGKKNPEVKTGRFLPALDTLHMQLFACGAIASALNGTG